MLGLGLGTQKVNMAVFGGIPLPTPLAKWIGDSMSGGDGDNLDVEWLDQIGGKKLDCNSTGLMTVSTAKFNGHKSLRVNNTNSNSCYWLHNIKDNTNNCTIFMVASFAEWGTGVGSTTLFDFQSDGFAVNYYTIGPIRYMLDYDIDNPGGDTIGVNDLDPFKIDRVFAFDYRGTYLNIYMDGVLFDVRPNRWTPKPIDGLISVFGRASTNIRTVPVDSYLAEFSIYENLTGDEIIAITDELKTIYGTASGKD